VLARNPLAAAEGPLQAHYKQLKYASGDLEPAWAFWKAHIGVDPFTFATRLTEGLEPRMADGKLGFGEHPVEISIIHLAGSKKQSLQFNLRIDKTREEIARAKEAAAKESERGAKATKRVAEATTEAERAEAQREEFRASSAAYAALGKNHWLSVSRQFDFDEKAGMSVHDIRTDVEPAREGRGSRVFRNLLALYKTFTAAPGKLSLDATESGKSAWVHFGFRPEDWKPVAEQIRAEVERTLVERIEFRIARADLGAVELLAKARFERWIAASDAVPPPAKPAPVTLPNGIPSTLEETLRERVLDRLEPWLEACIGDRELSRDTLEKLVTPLPELARELAATKEYLDVLAAATSPCQVKGERVRSLPFGQPLSPEEAVNVETALERNDAEGPAKLLQACGKHRELFEQIMGRGPGWKGSINLADQREYDALVERVKPR
jgi:hypothetical protein